MASTRITDTKLGAQVGDIHFDAAANVMSVKTDDGSWVPVTTVSPTTAPNFTIAASSIGPLTMPTVKYKTQTFDDRPTLFGDRPRVTYVLSDLELETAKSDGFLLTRYREINLRKLEHFVKGVCPDCHGCVHAVIEEAEMDDPIMAQKKVALTARCNLSTSHTHHIQCPDGKYAVAKGSTAMVPTETKPVEPSFTDLPGDTEVLKQEPAPYIRSQERDRPTSAAPDAW